LIDWLNNLPPAALPAWGGFVLSLVLAIVKLWELYSGRARIEIGGDYASLDSVGNQIYIRNLSPKPIILIYWEVYYGTKPLFFRKETPISSPESSVNATIAAGSTYQLSFEDEHHFSTSVAALNGRAIFMRLFIAGRSRPIVRKIYSH